jgi:hypothetical protein
MMTRSRYIQLLCTATLTLLVTACEDIPGAAYYQRGTPESLLDASSERVSIDLANNPNAQTQLLQWLNQAQPTRAELNCVDGDLMCATLQNTLSQYNVPVERSASGNNLALVYDSLQARDCNNRYIDNPRNPYHLSHPTFGCSIAANIVQSVTDKRQFTSPALTDAGDGRRAYQVLRGAAQPNTYAAPSINTDFQPLAGSGSSE